MTTVTSVFPPNGLPPWRTGLRSIQSRSEADDDICPFAPDRERPRLLAGRAANGSDSHQLHACHKRNNRHLRKIVLQYRAATVKNGPNQAAVAALGHFK